MARYRTEFGVLVDIPEEKAARMIGLTPEAVPSAPRRRRKAKAQTDSEQPANGS